MRLRNPQTTKHSVLVVLTRTLAATSPRSHQPINSGPSRLCGNAEAGRRSCGGFPLLT